MHYHPRATVLTSVEFDHADIYRDLDHVRGAFDRYLGDLSKRAALLYSDSDDNVLDLVRHASCRRFSYGRNQASHWRLGDIEISAERTHFTVRKEGQRYGKFATRLIGEHNLMNALAAIGVADDLGLEPEAIRKGLAVFSGVRRRQEVRGVKSGVTVIDDFAHHPTAVRETVRAVKSFYPQRRLWAVFEPRTNSSMRKVFQDLYPLCFHGADMVCIREPAMLHKIPADERFSSRQLVRDLAARGHRAHFFTDTDAILTFLEQRLESRDVVLIMSNGGFDNIHARLLERL
jgi:UDP-N-acetylmuramate: L-alanyl-gamma-D-glutamyl-meso-diaminopimelate ligase